MPPPYGVFSRVPFYLCTIGVLLTAFYMTRQVYYVFFGKPREVEITGDTSHSGAATVALTSRESPAVMIVPLIILAAFSILLGLIGTPAWPWFSSFLNSEQPKLDFRGFAEKGILPVILSSTIIFLLGLGLGWWFYGRKPVGSAEAPDALDRLQPQIFNVLRNGLFVDELYEATIIRFNSWCARFCDWLDQWIWSGAVRLVSYFVLSLSWLSRSLDVYVVNRALMKAAATWPAAEKFSHASKMDAPRVTCASLGLLLRCSSYS